MITVEVDPDPRDMSIEELDRLNKDYRVDQDSIYCLTENERRIFETQNHRASLKEKIEERESELAVLRKHLERVDEVLHWISKPGYFEQKEKEAQRQQEIRRQTLESGYAGVSQEILDKLSRPLVTELPEDMEEIVYNEAEDPRINKRNGK